MRNWAASGLVLISLTWVRAVLRRRRGQFPPAEGTLPHLTDAQPVAVTRDRPPFRADRTTRAMNNESGCRLAGLIDHHNRVEVQHARGGVSHRLLGGGADDSGGVQNVRIACPDDPGITLEPVSAITDSRARRDGIEVPGASQRHRA